jgi:hypothetical protein
MTTMAQARLAATLALFSAFGCGSSNVDEPVDNGGAGHASTDGKGLQLSIDGEHRTFVELATPSVVEVDGVGDHSILWDIALQGRDVFTNGGISGPGHGSAFGPLSAPTYLSDTAPEVPLMLEDRAGGAFIDWYYYGGSTHQLFSRYHVYALRDGDRFFKLQILGYYAEQLGAPVSALYRVRYAEVTDAGVLETHELTSIDATAGGSEDNHDEASACLGLDTERLTSLTPAEAVESSDWQLCFRRASIAVNGGLSGPRGVLAVDLQADQIADETEDDVQARTADGESSLFDAVDFTTLTDAALDYRADGVVTAFAQRWLEPGSEPLAVRDYVWLATGADGASKYLLKFADLAGDPASEPSTLHLDAKPVR